MGLDEPRTPGADGQPSEDEQSLIDFVLGRCDEQSAGEIRRRLAGGGEFAARHREISSALEALGEWQVADPPANLVERTLARVSAQRRSEALLVEGRRPRSLVPAFSMRELGAIAAAVLLAVGIFIPSLSQAHKRAQRSQCAWNQGQIGSGLAHYANANDDVLPASPVNAGSWLASGGQPPASNSAGLFVLVRSGHVPAEVFRCPAAGGRSFEVRMGMVDFPSPQTIGYSYQHTLAGPVSRAGLDDVARREMRILADNTPVFEKGVFRPERSDTVSGNHSGAGQNVLSLAPHVAWVTNNYVGVDGDNIFLAEGVTEYNGSEKPASRTDSFLLPTPGR